MKAKNLTEPKKKKCECGRDLVTSHFCSPLLSEVTRKEICVDCKVVETIGKIRSRSMEV
jgi:hypothetical protein